MIDPKCLLQADLFAANAIGLRAKVVAFAKQLEANKHNNQMRFYSDTVPRQHAVKDITTLEKDPCLCGKHGMPMSVPAMSEVAQALLNLSADAPEMLQLPKCSGSKGCGKRTVAVTPSTDKQRLHYNTKKWMDDIISNATTDESVATIDIVRVLI